MGFPELPALADCERVAVEDELIVSAHGVAVKDRHAFLRGDAREHLEAPLGLADGEGRGAQVHDQIGALRGQRFHW